MYSFHIYTCLIFCHFVITGYASSPPDGNLNSALTLEMMKNATSSNNLPTGHTPTTAKPQPAPENCSDQTPGKLKTCQGYNGACQQLGYECLQCDFNCSCVYGQKINVTCRPREAVECKGEKDEWSVEMTCLYCYQTEPWQHTCQGTDQCEAVSSPRETFKSNCTVSSDVLCMGRRTFLKKLPCNWTSGYKWSTALLLSITLGGFGADRFYLGHWQEGIGKLFSFGGLGVWTIIDVILIAIRYIGPADGSLYI
ncbi:hypothetical protein Pcinc_043977 [Petrolisthes cinctipes]|uniref:TM2 domain-containing protein n=1 Tax=Petrolisthes cinctipes TaxID=88211 RepID=A0AAE1EFS8_PETCI|nr:hypothetical protein Pcinc_043977 [Petrolisthes cinctipes]